METTSLTTQAKSSQGKAPMSDDGEASVSAIHEQHRDLVEAATLAPSVHNTQPWRFSSDGDDLDLWLDQDRQLSYVDWDGRQAHLSCGAALMHVRVAARARGLDVETELLPDQADGTHLARLRLTAGMPAQPDEVALAEAILCRHTYREAFEERPVPPALLQVLRDDAGSEGASVMIVSDPDVLLEFEVLLAQADRGEELDPAYREELAAWVGGERTDDGIPTAALPGDPERGSSLRLRDFALRGASGDHADPPAPERPAVVVLSSVDDTPLSWLQAGQALGAVLLRAAQAGVQAQPLGQISDSVGYRWRLGVLLGLVSTPQLALRLGYADAVASTPRRAVDDVLVDRGQLPEQR